MDINIVWAAGLLEGEGCFSRHLRKSNGQIGYAIHCEMTDEDVVRKLHSIFKVGTVVPRLNISGRKDKRTRKQSWIWSVQNKAGVVQVLSQIKPYMCSRRLEKINLMLGELCENC